MSTIPQALLDAAETFGDAEALVDGDVRLTWTQLLGEVRTVARFYRAQGVGPGDRVAVWAPNTWHWVVSALGVHYAGATLVPINTRYTGHEALDILQRTRAVSLVVVGPFLGADRLAQLRAAGETPDLRTVVQISLDGSLVADGAIGWTDIPPGADMSAESSALAVGPDDVSDILFTS